jgi:hypothetical protein
VSIDFAKDASLWFNDPPTDEVEPTAEPIDEVEPTPDPVDDSPVQVTLPQSTPQPADTEPAASAGGPSVPQPANSEPDWIDLHTPIHPQLAAGVASQELAEHQELMAAKEFELAELDKELQNATAGVAMELFQRRRTCTDQLEWLMQALPRVKAKSHWEYCEKLKSSINSDWQTLAERRLQAVRVVEKYVISLIAAITQLEGVQAEQAHAVMRGSEIDRLVPGSGDVPNSKLYTDLTGTLSRELLWVRHRLEQKLPRLQWSPFSSSPTMPISEAELAYRHRVY